MKNLYYILLFICLCSVVALSVLPVQCKHSKDTYCGSCGTCQGMGVKTFPDRDLIKQLYREGKLTENTPRQHRVTWDEDGIVNLTGTCDN